MYLPLGILYCELWMSISCSCPFFLRKLGVFVLTFSLHPMHKYIVRALLYFFSIVRALLIALQLYPCYLRDTIYKRKLRASHVVLDKNINERFISSIPKYGTFCFCLDTSFSLYIQAVDIYKKMQKIYIQLSLGCPII